MQMENTSEGQDQKVPEKVFYVSTQEEKQTVHQQICSAGLNHWSSLCTESVGGA